MNTPNTVNLGHRLEIKDVESAHRRLLEALDRGTDLNVNVSGLAILDTAGLQLLLALQAEGTKRGRPVVFSGQSAALTQAMTALGLRGALHVQIGSDRL